MQWAKQKQAGFTIVELLIVVVLIAILAAITIVSYNGIQNRAKDSAAQSAATQAAKKLGTFAVTNNEVYPDDLLASGMNFTPSPDVVYEYRVATDKKSYCLTTTRQNTAYYITDSTAPVKGGCVGHTGAGQRPAANLAINPSVEANANFYSGFGGSGGGVVTGGRISPGGLFGSSFYRQQWTTAPSASGGAYVQYAGTGSVVIDAGKQYTTRISARASWNTTTRLAVIWWNSSNVEISRINGASDTVMTANQWYDLTATGVAPAGAVRVRVVVDNIGALPSVGATLDADGVLIAEGPGPYGYWDGSSPGWVWDGAQDLSTSKRQP